jgi:hypothetical protein
VLCAAFRALRPAARVAAAIAAAAGIRTARFTARAAPARFATGSATIRTGAGTPGSVTITASVIGLAGKSPAVAAAPAAASTTGLAAAASLAAALAARAATAIGLATAASFAAAARLPRTTQQVAQTVRETARSGERHCKNQREGRQNAVHLFILDAA